MAESSYLQLLDWRRRMSELFATVRTRTPDATTLEWFRAEKDRLFTTHPQSPIEPPRRSTFDGLEYWPFEATARVVGTFVEAQTQPSFGEGELALRRIGDVAFTLFGHDLRLPVLWIEGYAGGLFIPFRDATSGTETYGGGRYLLDTIKSADLGSDAADGSIVLDFNYAYHPSCTYDPRWVCPLAPPQSMLSLPIRVGERLK